MKLGIVGLPNTGKSTLFNAIMQTGAKAANYPFSTVTPNVGNVPVPDERLQRLGSLTVSKRKESVKGGKQRLRPYFFVKKGLVYTSNI